MKICEVCGHEAEDDYVYCLKCGSRLDGKKICPRCAKPIPKESAVCPYCGVRLDGKFCCPSCGKLLERDTVFCTACGKPVGAAPSYAPPRQADPAPAPAPYQGAAALQPGASATETNRDKIFRILTVSLCMAALLVMALCSFFSLYSYSVTATVSGSAIGARESYGAFYYLVDQWDEIETAVEMLSRGMFADGYYLVGGITAAAVGINLFVSLIMFILGTIDGILVLIGKKQKTRILGYTAAAFAPWVLLGMVLVSCGGSAVTGMLGVLNGISGISVGLGAGAICAIVFGAVFLAAALVLRFVQDGLKKKRISVLPLCGTLAVIVLMAAFGALMSGSVMRNEATRSLAMPLLSMCQNVLIMEDATGEQLAYAAVLSALFVIAAAVCSVLLWNALNRLFSEKKTNCNFLWQGIVLFVLGALICVFTALLLQSMNAGFEAAEDRSVLAAPVIAGAVFGGLLLAASVVFCILCWPKPAQAAPAQGYGWASAYPVYPGYPAPAVPAAPAPVPAQETPAGGSGMSGETEGREGTEETKTESEQ